ncbi:MAG: S9 family peptidase [Chloroflexi bacterium]|nr:S9 family peptidase [Chloroflexota bacterium]
MNADVKSTSDETIKRMARVGSCWSPTFSPDGLKLAFVSDMTGSPQIWQLPAAGGYPRAVTAFEEQISEVSWSPAGDWLAIQAAPGGGMNSQIDLVRLNGAGRRRITPGGATNNWLNCWMPDGAALIFSSNMDDANSMNSYLYCMKTGETRRIAVNSGVGVVEHVARDGGQFLLSRVVYRGDNNIFLASLENDDERLLTEHEPPASFGNARFSHDGGSVFMLTNRDHDLACFVRVRLEQGAAWETLQSRADAELEQFAVAAEDRLSALVWNCAGRHELELFDLAVNRLVAKIGLPGEIVDEIRFSTDGDKLALVVSGARLPQDIWLLDTADRRLRRLTHSPHVGVDLDALAGAELRRYTAHDGLHLTGWLYRPTAGSAPYPTVLSFHGGPEGQEQPRFRYEYQALVSQGIAVFAPNVRGSSGFGKRFVNLDNGALRVDAIQDIASTARYLIESGLTTPGRVGIMGGSYGGYMTMAGLAEFPDLFAAGVNIYGLVNFKTFFEQTEPWMAAISKIEYGDPETEGDLLDALSPIHNLDRVAAPVLVLHGANDTNVPVYEAEQVVAKLRARGLPVEYILFPDEGHGFRKEENRIATAIAVVNWFAEYLL